MRDDPRPQEIYRHFKGGLYQVITLAKHARTGDILVIYQALYGEFTVYARELSEFLSKTDRKKYPSSTQENRFEKVTAEEKEENIQAAESEAKPPQEAVPAQKAEMPREPEPAPKEDTMQKPEAVQEFGTNQTDVTPGRNQERTEAEEQETENQTEETINIDPLVLEFLDADSYGERLNILAALHSRITDEMINTMSVAVDVEVNEGDIEERYEALKTCLVTLEKYECSRLR